MENLLREPLTRENYEKTVGQRLNEALKKFKNNQNGVGADNDSNFDQVDPGVGVLLLFSCMYKKEDIALYILNSPIFKYINYNQIIKFDHTLYFYNETDATAFNICM